MQLARAQVQLEQVRLERELLLGHARRNDGGKGGGGSGPAAGIITQWALLDGVSQQTEPARLEQPWSWQ